MSPVQVGLPESQPNASGVVVEVQVEGTEPEWLRAVKDLFGPSGQ